MKEMGKELDFRTIREEWMNIQLEDGTIIRFKSVLVRVFETGRTDPITGEPIYSVEGQNIVVARAPDELRGEPSDFIPPIPELAKKKKPIEVGIKGITGDEWNEYELETGKKIKTKAIISKVLRIDDYYDRYGNPIYIVQSQMVATGSPKYEIIGDTRKGEGFLTSTAPSPENLIQGTSSKTEEKWIKVESTNEYCVCVFGANIPPLLEIIEPKGIFGYLKGWRIDAQKLKDELREIYE